MKNALLLLVGLVALGCDEPLKSVELIAEPRVLGARVEVAGDAGRAAPAPGETATASFLVASPELAPELGFALAACSAAPRQGDRATCQDEPFAQVISENGLAAPPSLDFTVPAEVDAEGRVLVLGVICPGGSPSPDGSRCDGAAPGTQVLLELELSRSDDVNQNPTLEPESVSFDEQAWPELQAMEGDCQGLGFVEVGAGTKHTLRVELDEADRDPLPIASELDPLRESLQLSHFTTAGDLSRAFETIAWDSDALSRSVTFTAPKEPGLLRLWLVLRDLRGGSDFTERALCVLP